VHRAGSLEARPRSWQTLASLIPPLKASVFVGTSLDGFLARRDGRFDFLPEGGGEEHGYTDFIASVDTLVIGRNTYDVVLGFPDWPYAGKRVVVLSSRPIASPRDPSARVERMEGEPREIAARLAATGSKHVYVDGGLTVQAFLRAGLVQRLTITRVPVLIGEGIPLFGPLLRDLRLRHLGTRSYASGLVTSEYELIATGEGEAKA
jgi:dihydrofolate reductase